MHFCSERNHPTNAVNHAKGTKHPFTSAVHSSLFQLFCSVDFGLTGCSASLAGPCFEFDTEGDCLEVALAGAESLAANTKLLSDKIELYYSERELSILDVRNYAKTNQKSLLYWLYYAKACNEFVTPIYVA